ncbi:MAG: bifunctional oligoribonuclease/PAP phosphatase NrnA [Flavobacteriia bacterium]|nr:bifunctional oligoribonuclease/PAP phosphatase NrnA [Flavobacteriia bacterium]
MNRFSKNKEIFEGLTGLKIMIDHHPEPATHEFDAHYSEVSASSTCQLIWELYEQTDETALTPVSAKALYTGLVTDTGSFQFDSVTPKTLDSAAQILRLGGFKPNEVVEKVFSAKTLATQLALGAALSRLVVYEGGKISVITLPFDILAEYEEMGEVDTDGFVNHGLHIEGVDVALFCKETAPGEVKCSLRSRHFADVNQWARKLGGGGHVRAAGVFVSDGLDRAVDRLITTGKELYPELFN